VKMTPANSPHGIAGGCHCPYTRPWWSTVFWLFNEQRVHETKKEEQSNYVIFWEGTCNKEGGSKSSCDFLISSLRLSLCSSPLWSAVSTRPPATGHLLLPQVQRQAATRSPTLQKWSWALRREPEKKNKEKKQVGGRESRGHCKKNLFLKFYYFSGWGEDEGEGSAISPPYQFVIHRNCWRPCCQQGRHRRGRLPCWPPRTGGRLGSQISLRMHQTILLAHAAVVGGLSAATAPAAP
jgi:hypothetical protein